VIRFSGFERLGPAVAAFSEKSDGDCRVVGASDLRRSSWNRQFVMMVCCLEAREPVFVSQVHGTDILIAREDGPAHDELAEADGILTDVPGLPVGILVADCVPVYLFDPVARVGGVIHAGRAGTMLGIAGRAVDALQREWGSEPGNVHALIGPSAGPGRYEVSEEIAEEWRGLGLPAEGRLLDLWQGNVDQLVRAGVEGSNIQVSGLCTMTDGRFFSYRCGSTSERNLALFAL
jgi:purine-nucleoside/S-methyl-5'-thioadenosine phosphorylase / adenosine deaminase